MKEALTHLLQWENIGTRDLIWHHPNRSLLWGSRLLVQKDQVAFLLTAGNLVQKPRLYDFFVAGEYTISLEYVPLYLNEHQDEVKDDSIKGSIIFCSLKEFSFSKQIHTGYSLGQYGMALEAIAKCRIQVCDANRLFQSIVVRHRIFSTNRLLKHLGKGLANELLRRDHTYGPNHLGLVTFHQKLENLGITVLSLEFASYKAEGYGTLT